MFAVAIERCPLDGWLVGGTVGGPIKAHGFIIVTDLEIPSSMTDWETDDQGAKMGG